MPTANPCSSASAYEENLISLNTKKKWTTISRETEGQKMQEEISTAVRESTKLQKSRKELVIPSPWYSYQNMQIKM